MRERVARILLYSVSGCLGVGVAALFYNCYHLAMVIFGIGTVCGLVAYLIPEQEEAS